MISADWGCVKVGETSERPETELYVAHGEPVLLVLVLVLLLLLLVLLLLLLRAAVAVWSRAAAAAPAPLPPLPDLTSPRASSSS